MNGIINLLKPPGISSNGAVIYMRRLTGVKKTGHAGTLDPGASGVLPICVGRVTKLSAYFLDSAKEYIAEICFGKSTDTGDSYGQITLSGGRNPVAEEVKEALRLFLGETRQRTPAFSAAKHNGRKLYELARAGMEIPEKYRDIVIEELEYIKQTGGDSHIIRIFCGKGTYIRALCEDLGKALGTFAHMSFLVRTKSAGLEIVNSHTFEEIESMENVESAMLRADSLLTRFPEIIIEKCERKVLFNGGAILSDCGCGTYRIYCDDEFIGLAEWKNGRLKIVVLAAED